MLRKPIIAAVVMLAASSLNSFAQPDSKPNASATPDLTSPQSFPSNSYIRPDSKTRFKRFVKGTVGPVAIARQVVGAGISTGRNSPEEWGPHWEGFGRRVASNFGKSAIKQVTIYGLDEVFKFDSHYYRSTKKDAGSKIRNALISPVTARNRSGKRVIGIPRIAGTYASSMIAAETWYPARYGWKNGVRNATTSLGINAAYNFFKEFIWK